jgi:membrane protein implicated in regulation of membrane protease activity
MLRTIFMIGLFAIGGLFILKLFFGVFAVFFALLLKLLGMAIWIAIVGALIYLVIRIFSPDTARRLREKWSGTTSI